MGKTDLRFLTIILLTVALAWALVIDYIFGLAYAYALWTYASVMIVFVISNLLTCEYWN